MQEEVSATNVVHLLLLVPEIMVGVLVVLTEGEAVGDKAVEAVVMMVEVVEVAEVVLMAIIKGEMMVGMGRSLQLRPPLMVGRVAITHHQAIFTGILVMERMQFLHLRAILVDLIRIPHHMVLLVVMAAMLWVVPAMVDVVADQVDMTVAGRVDMMVAGLVDMMVGTVVIQEMLEVDMALLLPRLLLGR